MSGTFSKARFFKVMWRPNGLNISFSQSPPPPGHAGPAPAPGCWAALTSLVYLSRSLGPNDAPRTPLVRHPGPPLGPGEARTIVGRGGGSDDDANNTAAPGGLRQPRTISVAVLFLSSPQRGAADIIML